MSIDTINFEINHLENIVFLKYYSIFPYLL